ncbi:octopamine receptor 1-like [Acanthaster planci]|uniref:Octopamine receptor 1-like n=1 Tax=Acanthaster planci TaxID=133434 RepID=A0A8B8A0B0_ACAPL|nr:octopamine receptor 1-like [Acanthaster planci]
MELLGNESHWMVNDTDTDICSEETPVFCLTRTKTYLPRPEEVHSNTGLDGELDGTTIRLQSHQSQPPADTGLGDNEGGQLASVEETRKRETSRQRSKQDQERGKRREFKRHRKAAVTLSVLVSVFVAMWLPFYVASLLAAICEECVSDLAWIVVNYLLWCNSTINPFLYALLVVQFRQNFLRFLGLRSCRK